MRTTFDCVLNSYGFGIRSSEIACDLRFANELEMGLKYCLPSDLERVNTCTPFDGPCCVFSEVSYLPLPFPSTVTSRLGALYFSWQ